MPLSKNMIYSEIVSEIISSYKEDGKIGNIRPKSMRHALKIANAIAARMKGVSKKQDKKKKA